MCTFTFSKRIPPLHISGINSARENGGNLWNEDRGRETFVGQSLWAGVPITLQNINDNKMRTSNTVCSRTAESFIRLSYIQFVKFWVIFLLSVQSKLIAVWGSTPQTSWLWSQYISAGQFDLLPIFPRLNCLKSTTQNLAAELHSSNVTTVF